LLGSEEEVRRRKPIPALAAAPAMCLAAHASDDSGPLCPLKKGERIYIHRDSVTTAAKKDVREYTDNPLTLTVDRHLTVLAHFGHLP
jgi:hypothetical protein